MLKHLLISIFLFLFISTNANAGVFQYRAINHSTKKCAYYNFYGGDEFKRIILPPGWEKVKETDNTYHFDKYCKSLEYNFLENELETKKLCCSWILYAIIFSTIFFVALIVILLFRFIVRKKKK